MKEVVYVVMLIAATYIVLRAVSVHLTIVQEPCTEGLDEDQLENLYTKLEPYVLRTLKRTPKD